LFDGFLKLYQEGRDDDVEGDDGRLPRLSVGDVPEAACGARRQHFTEPPPRYSEASLVKKLENSGSAAPRLTPAFSRPCATAPMCAWTAIASVPEDKGRIVTAFLTSFFKHYVEYDFTPILKKSSTKFPPGELSWKQLLRDFWKTSTSRPKRPKGLKFADVIDALDEILGPHMFPERDDGGDPRRCPTCGTGRLNLKLGKFGAFHRLLELSGMPLHAPVGRGGDENGDTSPRRSASIRSPVRKYR
jgi:DNA topoisomerase-1